MGCPKCADDNYRRADLRADGFTDKPETDINVCMCCGFEWVAAGETCLSLPVVPHTQP